VVAFDVAKGWRITVHKGRPVDATGEMPAGKRFRDVTEFKKILLRDKDLVARALTEKLLVYATGSVIRPADSAELEAIVAQSRADNYGLRSLIHAVVQSRVFLNK
jgi:hypothetical protein